MNPNELRVNNLVRFVKEDKISEIGHHNLGLLLSNPASNDFEPIPLTKERLLEFGAEKINNSMFRMGALTFQPTTFTDGGSLTEGLLNTRKAMRVCFCGKFLVNLEYVHQFQNLYFALTGEELVI